MTNQTPLLLLPGLLNDERVWKPICKSMPNRQDIFVSPTHTADTMIALAASAIRSMPPGKFAVAGFSLGGYRCGHMSTLEQPEAVAAAFARWTTIVDEGTSSQGS